MANNAFSCTIEADSISLPYTQLKHLEQYDFHPYHLEIILTLICIPKELLPIHFCIFRHSLHQDNTGSHTFL